jgi:hypothetical protein
VRVTGPPTLCGGSRQDDGPTDGSWSGATRSSSDPLRLCGATELPLCGRTRGAVGVPACECERRLLCRRRRRLVYTYNMQTRIIRQGQCALALLCRPCAGSSPLILFGTSPPWRISQNDRLIRFETEPRFQAVIKWRTRMICRQVTGAYRQTLYAPSRRKS